MAGSKRPPLFARAETERVQSRDACRIPVVCHIGDRRADDALVSNISAHGCLVRAVMIGVTKFESVTLAFGDEATVSGHLKWIRQASFGVEFDEPLEPDVLARIAALVAPSNVVPLRRPRLG